MKRLTRISYATFEGLRTTDSTLFHGLLNAAKAEPGGKIVRIDSVDIKGEAFQIRWAQWVERHPELVLSTTTEQDTLWQVENDAAKLEAAKAAVQKHAEEAAKRYFEYWVAQKGLIDTRRTRDILFEEMERVKKRDGADPSAALLDVVIERLQAQGIVFEWKLAELVVAPPPPPLPPVLLADGSEQLPLDASQYQMLHANVVQLRDWDARRRADQQRQLRENNNAVAIAFRDAAAANTPALEVEVV